LIHVDFEQPLDSVDLEQPLNFADLEPLLTPVDPEQEPTQIKVSIEVERTIL
jgi:hypothetical protein